MFSFESQLFPVFQSVVQIWKKGFPFVVFFSFHAAIQSQTIVWQEEERMEFSATITNFQFLELEKNVVHEMTEAQTMIRSCRGQIISRFVSSTLEGHVLHNWIFTRRNNDSETHYKRGLNWGWGKKERQIVPDSYSPRVKHWDPLLLPTKSCAYPGTFFSWGWGRWITHVPPSIKSLKSRDGPFHGWKWRFDFFFFFGKVDSTRSEIRCSGIKSQETRNKWKRRDVERGGTRRV